MEITLDLSKRYTFADYLTWCDDKSRELLNGFIRMMSPAPSFRHQEITGNLYGELRNIIKRRKGMCKVIPAPFDVVLPRNGETENGKIDTVVQPDICIICDPSKIINGRCVGAPDFIAEIQSPSTARYDMTEKYELYQSVGVREYWIVFPDSGVNSYILQEDGKYDNGTIYEWGEIPVATLGGVTIKLSDIL
jgi:Uma2 family endonuclease